MKLTDVQVDGFGVWSGLTLANLSPHCTVFYGPNEAGKTTLLQFLRAVLYGFSPERRSGYLPPLRGGAAGGMLSGALPDEGALKIHRREEPGRPLGSVTVEAADGTVQGEAHLHRLLHDVDEATFNNVFGVGLRELQELGTLTDLDAARWLYALTAGLDRISLYDVQQELERSRLRLMAGPAPSAPSGGERPSQVCELLSQRDRLRLELAQLAGLSQRHGQLAGDRATCEKDISDVAGELTAQEAEVGRLKAAVAAYDAWQRRGALEAQLSAIAQRNPWPADAVPRMKRIVWGIRQMRRRRQRLRARRKLLAGELRQISLNESLCRQAARIEALSEHESWITAAEQQLQAAEAIANSLGDQRQNQVARLQQMAPQISSLPLSLDEHAWQALRRPGASVAKAHRRYAAVERNITTHKEAAQNCRLQLETALASYGQRDLTAALEAAGQRVSQLRRRIQLDEQIEQLAKTQIDLEGRTAELTQRQILPPWVVIAVGSVFVLGVVLLLAGLVLPAAVTGSWGWSLALLGLLGSGLAVAAKFTLERSAALGLDACQKHFALVQSQIKQATDDREAIDRALPKMGGSVALRLPAAEQELAKLEELLPLETQRQSAEQTAAEIRLQGAVLKDNYLQARNRWRAALAVARLPETLTPPQARELLAVGSELSALARRHAEAQGDVDRHRRELAALSGRIEQTFVAAGLEPPPSASLGDQVRYLRRELAEHESRRQRRDTLRLKRQKLHRRQAALEQKGRRWRRRREKLLTDCHAADLAEFRRRAADFARVEALTAQRDAAAAEIISRLASAASETEVAAIIADNTQQQVDDQLAAAARQLDDSRRRQQRLFEQRGQLSEQIRLVGGDRRMAVKRYELAQVEQRLTNAIERWRVLTATGRLLEWIKRDYERNRQPETLRQASEYLQRMTAGHYRRVWTPLGENILLVDDAAGRPLPIDVLSRGTREQLFLSLRLALVALFARRGAVLPMILDDVLVNFDGHRAIAAVEVLRDFAAQGHQLLVFTCHEHVAQLFKNLRLDVRRLPSNTEAGHDLPFSIREELPPRRPRPRRTRESPPSNPPTSTESPAAPATTVVDTTTAVDGPSPDDEDTRHRVDPPEPLARRLPARRRRAAAAALTTEASSHSDRLLLINGNVWVESPEIEDGED